MKFIFDDMVINRNITIINNSFLNISCVSPVYLEKRLSTMCYRGWVNMSNTIDEYLRDDETHVHWVPQKGYSKE